MIDEVDKYGCSICGFMECTCYSKDELTRVLEDLREDDGRGGTYIIGYILILLITISAVSGLIWLIND